MEFLSDVEDADVEERLVGKAKVKWRYTK